MLLHRGAGRAWGCWPARAWPRAAACASASAAARQAAGAAPRPPAPGAGPARPAAGPPPPADGRGLVDDGVRVDWAAPLVRHGDARCGLVAEGLVEAMPAHVGSHVHAVRAALSRGLPRAFQLERLPGEDEEGAGWLRACLRAAEQHKRAQPRQPQHTGRLLAVCRGCTCCACEGVRRQPRDEARTELRLAECGAQHVQVRQPRVELRPRSAVEQRRQQVVQLPRVRKQRRLHGLRPGVHAAPTAVCTAAHTERRAALARQQRAEAAVA
ncbi:hypothetical protein T492DRAFT_542481 [Pavlovales sp. CCMP2436]|nr:hypothetical protein T492DRAFT_542481 [Pavlovales sp. CCMP2436]